MSTSGQRSDGQAVASPGLGLPIDPSVVVCEYSSACAGCSSCRRSQWKRPVTAVGPRSTGARVTLAVNTATRAGVDRALELQGWRAIGECRS